MARHSVIKPPVIHRRWPARRCSGLIASAVIACAAVAGCSTGGAHAAATTSSTSATTSSSTISTSTTATSEPPATSGPVVPTGAAPVPAKYQELFSHLSTNLDAYQAAIDAMPAAAPGTAIGVAGAELLPANGNRLKGLLNPATMVSVDAWLDRFHAMGIRGVTLGIKVPMLLDRFGPDADAYATFYATVADHARQRGMTVDVELGALFCGTAYAACTHPFDGTYRQFVADTVTQARIVIRRVRPRLLDIISEPTTEASLSGVQAFKTPAGVGRYVHDVLAGIGPRGDTKVGAGAATWLAPAYDQAILKQPVDFVVMHIYPINPKIAATIVDDTALAHRAGKPIVADEVGLYKTDTAEAGAGVADTIYRLDTFSFFQPLDVRFLSITGQWAKKAGVSYLSPFWAGQFFAYLRWTPALDALPFPALNQKANQVIARAFAAGQLTEYGRLWPSAF